MMISQPISFKKAKEDLENIFWGGVAVPVFIFWEFGILARETYDLFNERCYEPAKSEISKIKAGKSREGAERYVKNVSDEDRYHLIMRDGQKYLLESTEVFEDSGFEKPRNFLGIVGRVVNSGKLYSKPYSQVVFPQIEIEGEYGWREYHDCVRIRDRIERKNLWNAIEHIRKSEKNLNIDSGENKNEPSEQDLFGDLF